MISAVVLQHNLHERTAVALDSLRASRLPVDELILVDNASDECSRAWAHGARADLKIFYDTNLGYSGGTNAGWRCAACDYILLCNNDVALADSCIGHLVGAMEQYPRIGWLSACYQDGGWPPCIVAFPDLVNARLCATRGQERDWFNQWAATLKAAPQFCGVTEATVVMVRKAASDAVGYFNDALWYHHSHDYSLRLAEAGWQTAFLRSAVFWHDTTHPTLTHIGAKVDWHQKRCEATAIMDKRWGARWHSLA